MKFTTALVNKETEAPRGTRYLPEIVGVCGCQDCPSGGGSGSRGPLLGSSPGMPATGVVQLPDT